MTKTLLIVAQPEHQETGVFMEETKKDRSSLLWRCEASHGTKLSQESWLWWVMGSSRPAKVVAVSEVQNMKSSGKIMKWIVNSLCIFPCLPPLPSASMESTGRLWLHRGNAHTYGVVTQPRWECHTWKDIASLGSASSLDGYYFRGSYEVRLLLWF